MAFAVLLFIVAPVAFGVGLQKEPKCKANFHSYKAKPVVKWLAPRWPIFKKLCGDTVGWKVLKDEKQLLEREQGLTREQCDAAGHVVEYIDCMLERCIATFHTESISNFRFSKPPTMAKQFEYARKYLDDELVKIVTQKTYALAGHGQPTDLDGVAGGTDGKEGKMNAFVMYYCQEALLKDQTLEQQWRNKILPKMAEWKTKCPYKGKGSVVQAKAKDSSKRVIRRLVQRFLQI